MTKWTANIILLMMAGVWAWLSIAEGMLQAVSDQFIYLALALASGDVGMAALDRFKKGGGNDNP